MTKEVIEKNPNCSVCWEDFKLEEQVMKLECNHCFHKVVILSLLRPLFQLSTIIVFSESLFAVGIEEE